MANVLNIPPNGTIKLYNNIDIGNGRQPIFSSRANQIAYYNAHLAKTIDGMSYMRMGDRIKIEATVDEMTNVNFMSFINRMGGTEREIYCYIDPNWEYINNNTIAISYSIASFQTMMFDVTFKPGVIDREHLSASEWAEATANPYRMGIQSLLTEEPLQMSGELEDMTVGVTEDGSPDGLTMFPESQYAQESKLSTQLVLVIGNGSFSDIPEWSDLMDDVKGAGGKVVDSLNITNTWFDISGIPAPSISYIVALPLGGDDVTTSSYTRIWDDIFDTIAKNQLTGNIIGLYYMPAWFLNNILTVNYNGTVFPSGDKSVIDLGVLTNNEQSYQPHNPKLYRYPYHYVRVSTSEGNSKNYLFEHFLQLAASGNLSDAKFYLVCNINGNPTICLVPSTYRRFNYYQDVWMSALNMTEMISYDNVPHIPYATDGYLSYLSTQASNILRGTSALDAKVNTIGSVSDGFFGLLDMASTPSDIVAQGAKSLMGASSPADQAIAAHDTGTYARGRMQSAVNTGLSTASLLSQNNLKSTLAGYASANKFYSGDRYSAYSLGVPKNAYKTLTADNIFLGSGSGFLQYLTNAPYNFLIKEVRLRGDVLAVYDKWLDYYGYASNRIGIPHVVSYFQGGTDQPHFASVDGDTVTYAKARVFCYGNSKAPKMMCDDIEQMFANGTLFIKKD